MPKNQMNLQLREASQLTGACWAIWLEHAIDWEILASYKLDKQQRERLLFYVQTTGVESWMGGAKSAKPGRSRKILHSIGLSGSTIYIFSDQMTQRVVLVGAEKLPEVAKRFWRVVALGNSGLSLFNPTTGPVLTIPDLGVPYYLPEVLDRVLGLVLQMATSKIGWLAIRSGDYFEVKAQLNCTGTSGERISIDSNPLLREIVKTRQVKQVGKDDIQWAMVPRAGYKEAMNTWAALPLEIGKRLIGLVAFWREQSILREEWNELQQLSRRVASYVDASITFSDLTDHLSRMALLNDFAVTITSALDPEQIAQRIFSLLQRTFGTERINLVVISPDNNGAQEFTYHDGMIVLQKLPLEEIIIPNFIEKSEDHRVDLISTASGYAPIYSGSQSALVVPMKSRRQLIGILGLESTDVAAFTVYDEHLLMVIASHLAGLFENVRLRFEAESRARNLKLLHEVIEQVIVKTDLRDVSQIAAELMARNFAYELVLIALTDGTEKNLKIMGIGGSAAEVVQETMRYMDETRSDGIVMRVAITGQNILVNDVSLSPIYLPIPNWEAGSEMCVALKDGDQTIGVIDVESHKKNAFSQNDLILLESLAGILSNVISSAGQYQRLQATVDQLQAAREELQERIIAQRMTESRLVQAAKLAAVGEMAAGIAHELNNPLTTISGFTELVLEEIPEKSGVKSDLELVLKEAQRARSVVRRLLDFARQGESARVRSDINEIVMDVLALVNHLLHTSGVQLITELSGDLPWISVDRNQIKQVILNLIHNALHAMPTGGELHVNTSSRRRDSRSWLTICLKDTGIGIAPENIERVFEPFFTTRSRDGGTGLGLSVTYGIITDHGGLIDVESQVSKGSMFTVWFPVEED
jgi:two-component system, NtrC family, sensor kinase